MKTQLHNNRDFLAGLLFLALGVGAFVVALSYPFGSLDKMGPGYFPRILGLILAGFGVVTMIRGLRNGEAIAGNWAWFPLLLLTISLVAFGFLMEHVGLIPALVVMFFAAARAGREFKFTEVLILTVIMCLAATAIFIWGLKLPYPLIAWPGK